MKTASFTKSITYKPTGPAIEVLLDTDFSKEIRIVFKKGQTMKAHKTPFPITVYIVSGEINFGVLTEMFHLKNGDIIALNGGVLHHLTALNDSVVRLTLSKNDNEHRVKTIQTS